MSNPERSKLPLHLCPDCLGNMVQTVHNHEVDQEFWWVERQCPECNWTDEGEYPNAMCETYDQVLMSGTKELVKSLERLTKSNMEDEAGRLALALEADLISVDDIVNWYHLPEVPLHVNW